MDSHVFGRATETQEQREVRLKKMEDAYRTLIECMGEDPTRNGIVDTPRRAAKALDFLTQGYSLTAEDVVTVFDEDHDDMVIVSNIEFYSQCEHHMLPFYGRVHVGYLPSGKILGLSKFARIVEVYARRLQVQERLTKQIAEVIMEVLQPTGCAVIVEAEHMCMQMRGVQKSGSQTTTSTMLGTFRTDSRTREEFLAHVYGHKRF